MAVFTPGMPCALCAAPIDSAEQAETFPPLVLPADDALAAFDDAAVHRTCLEAHPLADAALARRDEVNATLRGS